MEILMAILAVLWSKKMNGEGNGEENGNAEGYDVVNALFTWNIGALFM